LTAAEIAPIEDWLEIEAGVSALATTRHTELSEDVVFKKPFRLTSTAELMIGLGPFVSHTSSHPDVGSSHGVEIVFDFMFWPHKTRGWYLEEAILVRARSISEFRVAKAALGSSTRVVLCLGVNLKRAGPALNRSGTLISSACIAPVPRPLMDRLQSSLGVDAAPRVAYG
jgi:hypothetical protein